MAGTKIINVQKGDTFEEVFNTFTTTQAQEVIFIFPRGSRFSREESYFQQISAQAAATGRKVSVMTSDPIIGVFAKNNGLELLQSTTARPKKSAAPSTPVVDQAAMLASSLDLRDGEEDEEDEETDPDEKDQDLDNIEPTKEELEAEEMKLDQNKSISTDHDADEEDEEEDDEEEEGDLGDQFMLQHKSEEVDLAGTDNEVEPLATLTTAGSYAKKRSAIINNGLRKRLHASEQKTRDIARLWNNEEHISHKKGAVRSGGGWLRHWYYYLAGLIIIVGAVVLLTAKGSAQVVLNPQKQDQNFKLRVSASGSTAAVNIVDNKIPGQLFSVKETVSGSFPASGKKTVAQQASGSITIFNKTKDPQKLVATTRFESSNGLIFRIRSTITVPSATGSTPGTIEAIVYADKAGSEYNIPAGSFTVPGFKGTANYDNFGATSTEPMRGGIVGPSNVVNETDYSAAVTSLTKQAREKVLATLKTQADKLTIIDNAVELTIETPKSNAKAGEAADKLEMSITATARTIAFRPEDLDALLVEYMKKSNGITFSPKGLNIAVNDAAFSFDLKQTLFELNVTGQAIANIDTAGFAKNLAGLTSTQAEKLIKSSKEIESATIALKPTWKHSLPKDSSRINVTVED